MEQNEFDILRNELQTQIQQKRVETLRIMANVRPIGMQSELAHEHKKGILV